MGDIGDGEEVSSECVSNLPASPAICSRQQRQSFEECSPCVSTELAASKFDERGCRAPFPNAPEAAFCTPAGPANQRDAAGLGPQPISAQLLLSAQEKLREMYTPNVLAAPLLATPLFPGQVPPEAFVSCCDGSHECVPTCLEKRGSCPDLVCKNSLRAPLQRSVLLKGAPPHQLRVQRRILSSDVPVPLRGAPPLTYSATPGRAVSERTAEAPALSRVRRRCSAAAAALGESDDDTMSSSSSTSSKKRRQGNADSWVEGLLLERQQLHARCMELEASNARLMRQLSAALRTLQSERSASQAEVSRLRQKCTALGAFLPPSVAAFAQDTPPEILQQNRHVMLHTHSTP